MRSSSTTENESMSPKQPSVSLQPTTATFHPSPEVTMVVELPSQVSPHYPHKRASSGPLSPSAVLRDPSLFSRREQDQQQRRRQSSSSTSTTSDESSVASNQLKDLDAYELFTRLNAAVADAKKGKMPSNQAARQVLKSADALVNSLVEDREKDFSSDGLAVAECVKELVRRLSRFIKVKNRGHEIQTVVQAVYEAVEADRNDAAEGGMPLKQTAEDIVQAFMVLVKSVTQVVLDGRLADDLVVLVQALGDVFLPDDAVAHFDVLSAVASDDGGAAVRTTAKDALLPLLPRLPRLPPLPSKHQKQATGHTSNSLVNTMFAEALKLVFPAFGTAHSHDSNDVFSIVKASRLASRASSLGQQQDQQDQQGQQGPHADEGDDWGTSSQTEAKPSLDRELAVADLVHLLRALRKDEGKRALRRVVASLLDAGTLFASYWLYTLGGDEEDNLLESAGMCKMRIAEAAFESFLRRFSPEAAVTFMEPLRGMHGSLVQFSRDHMDAMVLVGTLLRIGIQGDVPLRDAFERQVETAALALREALALLEADLCGTRDDGVQVALQDHARTLYENLGDLWKAIDTDEDVKGIRAAFSGLMKALFVNEDGNVAFKPELLADFTDLVVPEILTEFASVRIPLIEFKDPQWEMRVEGIEVETKALLPSLCEIEFQNSVLFGLTRNVGYETANKVELKFHQITFNNPGLPFRAKSRKFVSVSENGYLDIDLANQGMTVTVNVTLFSTGPRVLQVNRVQADVEGLQIVIRDTHNDSLYQTFNKHIVKLIKQNLKTVVEDEVRSVLEKWDRQLVVMRRAFM